MVILQAAKFTNNLILSDGKIVVLWVIFGITSGTALSLSDYTQASIKYAEFYGLAQNSMRCISLAPNLRSHTVLFSICTQNTYSTPGTDEAGQVISLYSRSFWFDLDASMISAFHGQNARDHLMLIGGNSNLKNLNASELCVDIFGSLYIGSSAQGKMTSKFINIVGCTASIYMCGFGDSLENNATHSFYNVRDCKSEILVYPYTGTNECKDFIFLKNTARTCFEGNKEKNSFSRIFADSKVFDQPDPPSGDEIVSTFKGTSFPLTLIAECKEAGGEKTHAISIRNRNLIAHLSSVWISFKF